MRKPLTLVAISWLLITASWALLTLLNGASWILPAIFAALLPVVLVIAVIPHLLTWSGDCVVRWVCRLRGQEPPRRYLD